MLLFYTLSATAPCLAWPAIVRVPGNQPTIRAGINVAQTKDTVLIEPEKCPENILLNKPLTISSAFIMNGDESVIQKTIKNGRTKTINGSKDQAYTITGFSGGYTIFCIPAEKIQGGIPDIGSLEFDGKTSAAFIKELLIDVWPNPFDDEIFRVSGQIANPAGQRKTKWLRW